MISRRSWCVPSSTVVAAAGSLALWCGVSTAAAQSASVPTQPAPSAPAAPSPPAPAVVARAAAGGGQRELAVGFVGSELVARVCPQPGCAPAGGTAIALPADADPKGARLSVVRLAPERQVVHVLVPRANGAGTWEAVLGAAPGSGELRRVFAGDTGFVQGEDGLRHGPMVVISEPAGDGTRRIVIGEQQEDVSLCGRPTVLSPELLVPQDLSLKPALVQRLTVAERAAAAPVVARRATTEDAPPVAGLLRAVVATSAVGDPRALTDQDLDTTWAEGRSGAGRGEFAVLHAPPSVPLTGLEIVSRPSAAARPAGSGPKVLWVATDRALFQVTFPTDPFAEPGSRWRVDFPAPVTTDCLALVTDSAFDERPTAEVTFAEVAATSALTAATPDELATRLAAGDATAEAAVAMLRALGEPGFAAIARAFAGLPEAGRRVALDGIDQAPCAIGAPVFIAALGGPYPAQREHAALRLQRCGPDAAPALLAALGEASPGAIPKLAEQLALAAPAESIPALLARVPGGSAPLRRALRGELSRAAAVPVAEAAVRRALTDAALSEEARLELLRALGPLLPRFQPEAAVAFARLARRDASFRTRFLLAEPTAALAGSDGTARAWFDGSLLSDPSPHVRARFAEAVEAPTPFEEVLVRALRDPEVRVRVAALEALARSPSAQVGPTVAGLLRKDPWPMARAAAATVIAAAPADATLDRALIASLRDPSPRVRQPVVIAIGVRRVAAATRPVRRRLNDHDESVGVRIAAAGTLAALCDAAAVEPLTRLARRLADVQDPSPERRVAPAAVTALGKLHPTDLRQRLAPLLAEGAPPAARAAAQAALAAPAQCAPAR